MEFQSALHPIDIFLVIVYLAGIAVLGLWLSRGIKTGKDLFLGGRALPWWAVGTSLVVSDIGAKDMVGLADEGYSYGIVLTNFDFIGCIFPVLVAAFLFMPYLWLAGVYTIPEYLGRRYNATVRTIFAVVWGCFMIGTLGVIFVSAATMFENLLGWDFWVSVISTAVVVGLYTTLGGLKAVVITDFISCIILVIGAALICIFGLIEVGGWSGLQATIAALPQDQFETQHHFDLILPADSKSPYSWPAVLLGLGFVLGPAYWIGNQAIVQRTFGTRSQNEARASYVLCAAIKLVFPLLLVVPGLIGLALFHDQLGPTNPDLRDTSILPAVVQLLPPGVLGIVLGAFLAGVMSNLDSYVNSASTLWVTDIYQPFIYRNASDRHCLTVGRILIVAFMIGGVAGSFLVREHFESVYQAFQTFMSLFQGPLLALLLLGMLSRRTTAWGGVAGMVAGITVALLLTFAKPICNLYVNPIYEQYAGQPIIVIKDDISFLWVAWWSYVAALMMTVITSCFTRPHDENRLRGLVYWLPQIEEAAP